LLDLGDAAPVGIVCRGNAQEGLGVNAVGEVAPDYGLGLGGAAEVGEYLGEVFDTSAAEG
jgi:hypothetical protein